MDSGSIVHSIDGFSNLPNVIVHDILNRLEMQDIARLSILSKRFRDLCTSIPVLNIDCAKFEARPRKRRRFCNFLDRFMIVYSRRKRMKSFRVRWILREDEDEGYRVDTWINSAIFCNVQEIDVEILPQNKSKPFALPISAWRTLKVVKINLKDGILDLPSDSGPFGLNRLELESVGIAHDSLGDWLSDHCCSLHSLSLVEVHGIDHLGIDIQSLEVLIIRKHALDDLSSIDVLSDSLHHIRISWMFVESDRKSLTISAPSITRFILRGNIAEYNDLGLSKDLNLFKTPLSTSLTKMLFVTGRLIETLFEEELQTTSLCNVLVLRLDLFNGLDDKQVPIVAAFIKGMPNLNTLVIKSFNQPLSANTNYQQSNQFLVKSTSFDTEYWESQNLFIHQLEVVRIELNSVDNEMGLVKYILKHAKALKTMTIVYSTVNSSQASKVAWKIENIKRASAAATILLLPK